MAERKQEQHSVYRIPLNFVDSSTLFGGMVRTRNFIEGCALAAAVVFPVLKYLQISLEIKILILCLTGIPLLAFGCIGMGGESLTQFLGTFVKWFTRRRIMYGEGYAPEASPEPEAEPKTAESVKKEVWQIKKVNSGKYRRKVKREKKRAGRPELVSVPLLYRLFHEKADDKKRREERGKADNSVKMSQVKSKRGKNTTQEFLPVRDIKNGIIYTSDGHFIKMVEIEPINFLLRSAVEQQDIIFNFAQLLKICPVKLQFKVISKKAEIKELINTTIKEMMAETNKKCRELSADYINLIKTVGSRDAISRRFYVFFEYEDGNIKPSENEVLFTLKSAVNTFRTYLLRCGNKIVEYESEQEENEALASALFDITSRYNTKGETYEQRLERLKNLFVKREMEDELRFPDASAPDTIDFTHGKYVVVDGVYYSYLYIPSHGYKSLVPSAWLSGLVNAGEGIDLDVFYERLDRAKMQQRIGQQLRINLSRIKDTSDTNSDYDSIEGTINSGYYLKQGLSNNEDFYYINVLVTVMAFSKADLDYRIKEITKMVKAQDMDIWRCSFTQEQALLSTIPTVRLDNKLFDLSKRNILTTAAASAYLFTSYEMCDNKGILLGVNRHNNSLVVVDIFDSKKFKNANMCILGTSGSGKTFTMQSIALRLRRKGIPVFIIAPLKGHEFKRACTQIGGQFIKLSSGSPNCINIMEIRKTDTTATDLLDGYSDESLLAKKIENLLIFFSLLMPEITNVEEQLLDEALINTYLKKGIVSDNQSLIDPEDPDRYRTMPILEDLYNILSGEVGAKRIATILKRFVTGSAKSFNNQTNVNLDNKYVVVDISDLKGKMLPISMFIALEYVWDKCREDRTQNKAVFIDETWNLIGGSSSKVAAEYVLEIFKVIRGYGGAAISATQDIADFFSLENGKYGKGIINNSKTKIILNLESAEAAHVADVLGLTPTEEQTLRNAERGQGLLSSNSNNVTVTFTASSTEEELISTDAAALRRLAERKSLERAANG